MPYIDYDVPLPGEDAQLDAICDLAARCPHALEVLGRLPPEPLSIAAEAVFDLIISGDCTISYMLQQGVTADADSDHLARACHALLLALETRERKKAAANRLVMPRPESRW
jgi:hypothetical protein